MTTVEKAIEQLKWNKGQHVAVAIWCEDDVIGRAWERTLEITRKQARKIIDIIDRKQDCNLGITWDTLDVYTDEVLKGE